MKKNNYAVWLLCIFLFNSVWGNELGKPEYNILTKANRDKFTFTIFPIPPHAWGSPRNVADEEEQLDINKWDTSGIQGQPGATGLGYIQVDLKTTYFVRAFAITGYPGGSHKPTGEFFLEGSNNGHNWKMVGIGHPGQWHAPGTYPFRKEQIIPAIYPNAYRYYRVIATGWTNGYIIIYNWGLFT